MADALVEFLLSKLGHQLFPRTDGLRLEGDWTQQIQRLGNDMRRLEDILRDAGAKITADERIQDLKREIKGILYRLDNLVDILALVNESSSCLENPFGQILTRNAFNRSQIISELREISARTDYMLRLAKVLVVPGRTAEYDSDLVSDLLLKPLSRGHLHFAGRVEELNMLRHRILVEPDRAIAIRGTGGMGKTTITMYLSSTVMDEGHFHAFAGVRVIGKFQFRHVLLSLCKQLYGSDEDEILSEFHQETLLQRIGQVQEQKKCLIVVEDVWSLDDWETLRGAFPPSVNGSKLLVTTRLMEVAHQVALNESDLKLRPLTEDEGCNLFMRRILLNSGPASDFDIKETMREIGRKLTNFCGGLPLAIVNFQEFMTSKHIEASKIVRSPQPFFRESLGTVGSRSLLATVSSYDNLPAILRRCFLYLGHFPDQCQIEVEKLFLFLLSDGHIPLENCGRQLPIHIAESYLEDLAKKGIIELHEEEIPIITRFESCQINEMMQELALLKNKEEGFFEVVDFGRGMDLMRGYFSSSPRTEIYGFYINLDKYEERYGLRVVDDQKKNIHRLLLRVKENQEGLVWPKNLLNLAKFMYLRLLDFDGFDFRDTKLPRGMGKLTFLRYLSFRGCILPKLPFSIGNLKFLYILDLRVVYPSKIIIPNVLWKMKRLRHLYLPPSFETHDGHKLRLAGLKELETLTGFNASHVNIEDLLTLSNLCYLALKIVGNLNEINGIIELMSMESDDHSLRVSLEIMNFDCYTEERHSVLRKLLGCRALIALDIEGHMYRIPLYYKLSLNLTKIVLIGSELQEDPMKFLENLPKLSGLVLDEAFVGEEMKCSSSGFSELKCLEFLNLQYLHKWTVERGAMPKLSALAIRKCGKLSMHPDEIQFVLRLQKLDISMINEDFKNNIRNVVSTNQGDKDQHSPSIKIDE